MYKDYEFRTSLVSDFFALYDLGLGEEAYNRKLENPEFMDFFGLAMAYVGFDLESETGIQTIWRPMRDVEIIADCFGLNVDQFILLLDNFEFNDYTVGKDICNGEMGVVFRYWV